jgi:hypothetical protein
MRWTFMMCDRMNAQEAAGIEHGADRIHRHVQKMGCRAGMQPDVILERFDPIYSSTGTKMVRSPLA